MAQLKNIIASILLSAFTITSALAQDSLNVSLYYNDFIDSLPVNFRDSYYSECWGFTFEEKDYAVISSTLGVHFYDVTIPESSNQVAFEPAFVQGFNANWRDYHDYQNYLYAVNDITQGTLQIIDFSDLPNSTEIVYDSNNLFAEAHNIFIDTSAAILYVCGGSKNNNSSFDLATYSLANPTLPTLIEEYTMFDYVHDIYVKNGIAYIESPNIQTFFIADFSNPQSPVILGSLDSYPDAGYTHSGWLSEDENYYVLIDETYNSQLKLLDVSDPADIYVTDVFGSYFSDSSMAHNVIIIDNFAYVSYYNDGFQIFDISDPTNVVRAGYYDTYPLPKTGDYRGAWGVYPFENGKVIIGDRNGGLFVLDANAALNYDVVPPIANFQININWDSTYAGQENYFFQFLDYSSNNPTDWFWEFGDGNTSTDQNPTHSYDYTLIDEETDFEVCLTVSNSAGNNIFCETVTAFIPVNIENENDKILEVFPNPSKDIIFLKGAETIENIELTNIFGETLQLQTENNQINIGHLKSGFYFLKANNTIIKIVKQ